MQKIKIFLDVPYFWRTGFQDPASISMEGILIFNKHLTFLLSLALLFVVWLLVNAIHFFVGLGNRKKSQFVGSKKPEIAWLLVFLLTIPLVLFCDLAEICVTDLDPEHHHPTEREILLAVNPDMYSTIAQDKDLIREISWLVDEFQKRGYRDDRIRWAFWHATENFWSLEYSEKVLSLQEHFDKEDKAIEDAVLLENRSFLFLYVLFVFLFLVVPRGARGGR